MTDKMSVNLGDPVHEYLYIFLHARFIADGYASEDTVYIYVYIRNPGPVSGKILRLEVKLPKSLGQPLSFPCISSVFGLKIFMELVPLTEYVQSFTCRIQTKLLKQAIGHL